MKKILILIFVFIMVGMNITTTGVTIKRYPITTDEENIIYVGGDGPGNYSKIQDAIDNASDMDTVFVYKGLYFEHIRIDKDINLFGEDKDKTIIDAMGVETGVEIGANVNLSGFTIRHAVEGISNFVPPSPNNVYKFFVYGNIIKSNVVGIGLGGSFNSIIEHNNISYNELGINFFNADDYEVKNNNFINNDKSAYFEYVFYLQFMPRIKWKGNYWNNWNIGLPKAIRGEKVIVMVFRPGYVVKKSICPWYNIDWSPSKTPIEI